MTSSEFTQEELDFDHYLDQGIFNAHEAAYKSGYEGDNAEFTAEAIHAREGIVITKPGDTILDLDDPEADFEDDAELMGFLGKNACWDCSVDVAPGESCAPGHVTVTKNGKLIING